MHRLSELDIMQSFILAFGMNWMQSLQSSSFRSKSFIKGAHFSKFESWSPYGPKSQSLLPDLILAKM